VAHLDTRKIVRRTEENCRITLNYFTDSKLSLLKKLFDIPKSRGAEFAQASHEQGPLPKSATTVEKLAIGGAP